MGVGANAPSREVQAQAVGGLRVEPPEEREDHPVVHDALAVVGQQKSHRAEPWHRGRRAAGQAGKIWTRQATGIRKSVEG